MKIKRPPALRKTFVLLAAIGFGLLPLLLADVVVLQSGAVITGNILQQDASGVLMQMEYGTFRYPMAMVRDMKKEAAAAPHVSNNGQVIPDWAQIISLLANTGWAPEIKQVPATVINHGSFKYVPYVSFRCAYGGYEINVFGDLNNPAAIQIGAMGYLKDNDVAKSNCVNFICSVLANDADRKMVRALNWNQKDLQSNGGMNFETLLPGEMGSYGGWWVSVYIQNALASARASEAEILALAQPRVAAPAQPAVTNMDSAAAQPAAATQPAMTTQSGQITSSGTYSYGYGTTYAAATGWTSEELAAAHPATATTYPTATGNKTIPTAAGDMVYPRTYTREDGAYTHRR
jgi:hypothetical protein